MIIPTASVGGRTADDRLFDPFNLLWISYTVQKQRRIHKKISQLVCSPGPVILCRLREALADPDSIFV